MTDSEILFAYLEHEFKTETETSLGTFDNTLIADLVGADIGFPLSENGGLLTDEYGDEIYQSLTMPSLYDDHGYPMTSSLYHEDYCITDDELISDQVRLSTGEVVDIREYDVLVISHFWGYNYYTDYIKRTFPETTVIGIQEGSIQDVAFYSPTLQTYHRQALNAMDGYIAENEQYANYTRTFVDDVAFVPLQVPKKQFETVSEVGNKREAICIGVTTWNIDFSNFYTNALVVDALRDRGHDVTAEIVGVKDSQEKMVNSLAEFNFVETTGYIEDRFYEYLSEFRCAVLLTTRATAGRVSAECAGVGVPVVGNQANDLQQRCWPELSIDPYDIQSAIHLADRLMTDESFADRQVQSAQNTITDLQQHEETAGQLRSFIDRVRS